MTELDNALAAAEENHDLLPDFYERLLNTTLYIPTHETPEEDDTAASEGDAFSPLIMEAEGNPYLMVFDTRERLSAWAEKEVGFVALPAHVVVGMTPEKLYWALNVGTDHPRQFVPDEIAWLKTVVQRCKEMDAAGNEGGDKG